LHYTAAIQQTASRVYCRNSTDCTTGILLQFLADQVVNPKRSIATVTLGKLDIRDGFFNKTRIDSNPWVCGEQWLEYKLFQENNT